MAGVVVCLNQTLYQCMHAACSKQMAAHRSMLQLRTHIAKRLGRAPHSAGSGPVSLFLWSHLHMGRRRQAWLS
jgi:hypothetical protein